MSHANLSNWRKLPNPTKRVWIETLICCAIGLAIGALFGAAF